MARKDLTDSSYDNYLSKKAKTSRSALQELRQRKSERTSKGYSGWHFGIGDAPVKTRDKEEFKRELDKRGLMMKDDVKRNLR